MPSLAGRVLRLPLAGVAFLVLADTAIVALALPPILRELHTDVAGVAAVLGVYAVVLAVALMLAEWLGRTMGRARSARRHRTLRSRSLTCGLADELGVLLAARAVQATGGAGLLVTAHAALTGEAVGLRLWRLAALLGMAAGPAIGGVLTQAFGCGRSSSSRRRPRWRRCRGASPPRHSGSPGEGAGLPARFSPSPRLGSSPARSRPLSSSPCCCW